MRDDITIEGAPESTTEVDQPQSPQDTPVPAAELGTTPQAPAEGDRDAVKAEIRDQVIDVIKSIFDPEIPVDIWELGLIYKVDVKDDLFVDIDMTLTSPACPVAGSLPPEVEFKVLTVPHVTGASVQVVWDPPWTPDMMTEAAKLELNMFW